MLYVPFRMFSLPGGSLNITSMWVEFTGLNFLMFFNFSRLQGRSAT